MNIAEIPHCRLFGHFDEISGDLFVHLDIFDKDAWSMKLYRQMLDCWFEIQEYLKTNLNISKVKTVTIEGREDLEKFLNLFGFVAEEESLIVDGEEFIIMQVEF